MHKMNKKKLQQGMIKRHPDGFGFFIPDDTTLPDVYIPRHSMTGMMTNDKVVVSVEPERGTDRFRGDIVRILERGTKKVVGLFTPLPNGGGLVRDEGKGWGQDLKIKPVDTMNAQKGELVAIEILTFPEEGKDLTGKVIQILGSSADPMNDIQRIVHGLNIPSEFSPAAVREASKLQPLVDEKDIRGRKDLRELRFVTIDGATAKDFDDAIYVESNRQGFKLFVAIADVSHYVRPGSAIDKDAYERGTSVYFPNFVVPMLPEILSNELCSLNPHRPRLALVAEMQMDFTGTLTESHFYEAVIESHARVTYGEAQEILDGSEIEKLNHVAEDIKRASDLAKILMAKRFREGSLDLEIPETQLMIDAGGNPIDIIRSERLFSHRLIEEMMLAANVAVAKFFAAKEIPAIYRIHEPPNPDAIALLEKYLMNFGGRIKLDQGLLQKRLTKALQEFSGKPEAQVLNILTLRSMSQAKYSANNVGHFGLGFEFYTHFTSPIRRYPDLIVHRLLKNLAMPQGSGYRLMAEEDLQSAGTMLSACEQRAAKAERQIQAIKKARFMQKHLGEEFDGVISSVTKFGIFVLLRQFEVDGLVHIDNLGKQQFSRFEFDEDNLCLVSKKSGQKFSIGDSIRIRVVSADIDDGKIDFEPAPLEGEQVKKSVKSSDKNYEHAASSKAERYMKENARALGDVPDELDLDKLKVEDHAQGFKKQNREPEPFDPGKKLEEALRKRGLKPSGGGAGSDSRDSRDDLFSSDSRPARLTFAKPNSTNSNRYPDELIDRRRQKRRADDQDPPPRRSRTEDEDTETNSSAKKKDTWWPKKSGGKPNAAKNKSDRGSRPKKEGSKKKSKGGRSEAKRGSRR